MNTAHAVARVSRTSTTVFFLKALELFQPDVIADVGSRNGAEALLFRSAAPRAHIVAIEANPSLAARMRDGEALRDARVEIVSCAVSNVEGTGVLQIADPALGNGSLRAWTDRDTLERVDVPVRRLDTLIAAGRGERVALWIDVEGLAYEVLDGAGDLLDAVGLVHVEVETNERWRGGRRSEEVVSLMTRRGFRPAHVIMDAQTGQGDIVFVSQRAGISDAQLCSKIARYAAFRPLATLANAARLKQRLPGGYALLRKTVGAFLKR